MRDFRPHLASRHFAEDFRVVQLGRGTPWERLNPSGYIQVVFLLVEFRHFLWEDVSHHFGEFGPANQVNPRVPRRQSAMLGP